MLRPPHRDELIMANSDKQRHDMIEQMMLRQSGATQFVSVQLWENLATELSSIIGERGFESLFARSLHLASAAYPWLNPQASGATMLHLKQSMECNSADAAAASGALMRIFLDTLILLIGEHLTSSILGKAWRDDVNNAGTELQ